MEYDMNGIEYNAKNMEHVISVRPENSIWSSFVVRRVEAIRHSIARQFLQLSDAGRPMNHLELILYKSVIVADRVVTDPTPLSPTSSDRLRLTISW